MSKATNARAQLANFRSKVRVNEAEMRRVGAGAATAFIVGSLEKSGRMQDIPQIAGLPRTVTLGVLAKLGSSYSSGQASDYLDGVGDAALTLAVYQFAKGVSVSGSSEPGGSTSAELRRARALEARLSRELEASGLEGDDIDRELAALEAED